MKRMKILKINLIKYYSSQENDRERMYYNLPDEYYQRMRLEKLQEMFFSLCPENTTILDVGCGDGFGASFVLNGFRYSKYVGLDLSMKKLKRTKEFIKKSHTLLADAEELPFKKSSFDVVFCFETLEHLINPEKALQEIKRVVKDDGLCLISIPIDSTFQEKLLKLFNKVKSRKKNTFNEHIQFFSLSRILNLFKNNSFIILSNSYCVFLFPFCHTFIKHISYSTWAKIDNLLTKIPVSLLEIGIFDLMIGNKYAYFCVRNNKRE